MTLPADCGAAALVGSLSSIKDVTTLDATHPVPPPGLAPYDEEDFLDPEDLDAGIPGTRCPSHRRKAVHCARENAWALLKRSKPFSPLFLTMTFEDRGEGQPDSLYAFRSLKAAEPLLDRLFVEWVLAMEFDPLSGAPHFHGIAIARENIASGWQHQPYEEMTKLRSQARRENRAFTAFESDQYHGWQSCLRPNAHLRSIWEALRTELPVHGFGSGRPAQATPIQDWTRVIGYVVKDLKKSTKEFPRYRPGTSRVFYSKSFGPRWTTDFSWITSKTTLTRRRMSRIAGALRMEPEQCMSLFGRRRWHPRMLTLIGELNRAGRTWIHLPIDELERRVIDALTGLGERWKEDPNLRRTVKYRPTWAADVAQELGQRRHRFLAGLSEDEPADNPFDLTEDLERSRQNRVEVLRLGSAGALTQPD